MFPAPQQDSLFVPAVRFPDDLLQDDSLQRHRVLLLVFVHDQVQRVSHFDLQVEPNGKERARINPLDFLEGFFVFVSFPRLKKRIFIYANDEPSN